MSHVVVASATGSVGTADEVLRRVVWVPAVRGSTSEDVRMWDLEFGSDHVGVVAQFFNVAAQTCIWTFTLPAGLVMAIVGGATIPLLQGVLVGAQTAAFSYIVGRVLPGDHRLLDLHLGHAASDPRGRLS
ncbi:MAG: hypothetical protein ACTH2Q_00075 [Propionibacteriaceae bacterium]